MEFLGDLWNTLLFYPFLNVLLLLYKVLGENLGFAVIAIAIIVRLALVPLTKQQHGMMQKMAILRPRLEELNKQLKHNPEALAKEQMKLYREVGYNPLGCLTSFVPQILMLIAIVQVIQVVTNNDFTGLYRPIQDFVIGATEGFKIHTGFFMLDLSKNYNAIAQESGYFAPQGIAYFVLAVLVGVSQYFSTKFMQLMQGTARKKKANRNPDEPMSQEEMQAQAMETMNAIFPVMTAFITLGSPAVLGIYWFVQSIMFIAQYFFIDRKESIDALKGLVPFKN